MLVLILRLILILQWNKAVLIVTEKDKNKDEKGVRNKVERLRDRGFIAVIG